MSKVDVLAIMDRACRECPGPAFRQLEDARDAVVALIAAAANASNFDGLHTKNLRAMPFADEAMTKLRIAVHSIGAKN